MVQVLQAIAGTPTGGAMACRFLQAKWYDLESKMGAGSVNFAKVISAITQYGATKFDYDEVCFIFIYILIVSHYRNSLIRKVANNSMINFSVEIAGASIR